MKFSLILATYGRMDELNIFLSSLLNQRYKNFEVILVDQNDKLDLSKMVENYKKNLDIKHIKSPIKGLSVNRNIGAQNATGEVFCFPDDDCSYYPDTLEKVLKKFTNNTETDIVLGRIYDRTQKRNIIRRWPQTEKQVKSNNFFFLYSSITMFVQRSSFLPFDNNLGVGNYFGSYEDADFIFRLIDSGNKVIYTPTVDVSHPDLSIETMSPMKMQSYGLGFGAFCRKHSRSPSILIIFISSILFHMAKALFNLVFFKFDESQRRYVSASSRIKGFLEYEV